MSKKLGLALLLAVGFASSQAHAFELFAQVVVQPNFTSAEACNTVAPVVIYCQVTTYGQLQNGEWINAFNNVPLVPGECAYAYNYANAPFFFINGHAQAFCSF